jgi:methionine-rich copper-binding protein CopC
MKRRRRARSWTITWLAAALFFATGWAPGLAVAHAVLVRSTPPGRATLAEAPARVQLWFNERLEPAFSTLEVRSATGEQVDQKDARVAPEDSKQLSATLAPLAPGTYTVRYRVLSVDGHVVNSSFTFTVRPKAAAK